KSFQFGFEFVELCTHVGNAHADFLHLRAERFLLLAKSFLLLAELFLLLAEFLLGSPEFASAIDGGLVADNVGLLVNLKPDEVAGDALAKFLDMASVGGGARHGEGIGLAGDDDEALVVVVSVGISVVVGVCGLISHRLRTQRQRKRLSLGF